ncbi:hypothetical protein HYV30_02240 [Candidatus Kaiserbacteria bacterium]|nr:hypothetical protein [Candidatus Kaiserbacteria bacterium]
MNRKLILIIVFAALAGFAPQKSRANAVTVTGGVGTVQETISAIKNTITSNKSILTAINTGISKAADLANKASLELLVADKYIIKPLAYILSGNVLQAMTASVVAFVAGQTNGTGAPQFVQNVNEHMQKVGDKQALVFFAQLSRADSPFAGAVASSLRTNYLQQTSAAGFFAANQDTLSRTSPDINAFLAGDWSKGGVRTWFALTTQPQNNPYLLYNASQSQLSTLIASAQTASAKMLDWGQGMLSWCGDLASNQVTDDFGLDAGVAYDTPNCTKSDGSPGTIKTPGSSISAALNKAMSANQDKLAAAGEAGSEINSILGNVASAMQSLNISAQLIGGYGNSLGLAGAAQSSGGRPSALGQLSAPGYAGVTASDVFENASTLPTSGSDMSERIARYQAAWNAITAAANSASANAETFARYCPAQAAGSGVPSQIQLVFAQSAEAARIAADASAAVGRMQADLNTGGDTSASYVADMQALRTMRPTPSDVAQAEADAQSSGAVTAANFDYLTPDGLPLIDQMKFVELRIGVLESSCVMAQYRTAWESIIAAANTAQASVTALQNSCPSQASAAAGYAAQVQSVLARASTALQATSVSIADAEYAKAQAGSGAGTLLSQMNIVTVSAQTLQSSCQAPMIIEAP